VTVFVCVDDGGGMLFNKRRQSRDSKVLEDVVKTAGDGIIYISDFSEALFSESDISVISVPDPLYAVGKGGFAFIEDQPLLPYKDKIDRLIIYKWNKNYPKSTLLDVTPSKIGLRLKTKRDFKGTSHDKITREEYVR